MYEKLKERYEKNYIRDDQLDRYVALGVITQEQAETIKMVKITGGGGGLVLPFIFQVVCNLLSPGR